jgi:hypothetical protein
MVIQCPKRFVAVLRQGLIQMSYTWPNKTLQATAAALCALAVAMSHNAVVAEVSALPAAVPELGR